MAIPQLLVHDHKDNVGVVVVEGLTAGTEMLCVVTHDNSDFKLTANADIPIVGGSILSHSHFQGGNGNFPVLHAEVIESFNVKDVKLQMLDWPLSTIKVVGKDKTKVSTMADKVLQKWYAYENKELDIIRVSKDGERQNAVTPYATNKNGEFSLYLILRNNGTSKEYPNGIFHVHEDVWNIKSENIGIIEAMGQAVLPARLLQQIPKMIEAHNKKETKLPDDLKIHQTLWYLLGLLINPCKI